MAATNDSGATYSSPDQFHNGLTISGLFGLWISSLRQRVSQSTYKTYERIVRKHILPVLGEYEIDRLTVTDINDFLKGKMENGRLDERGGLSYKSVADISKILSSALKLVNWDYSSVSNKYAFVKSQHNDNDIETLTDAQARELIQYLIYYADRSNAGYLLCLFTGIKLSEICALKDADFDLNHNCLHIRRTLQRVTMRLAPEDGAENQDTVDYAPADSEYRDLDLPKELSAIIRFLLLSGKPDAYFLTGNSKSPLGPLTYKYRFQTVIADCGFPLKITFHALRHTFALMWINQYGNIEELSRALGHASVSETERHYSKLIKTNNLNYHSYVKLLVSFYSDIWLH